MVAYEVPILIRIFMSSLKEKATITTGKSSLSVYCCKNLGMISIDYPKNSGANPKIGNDINFFFEMIDFYVYLLDFYNAFKETFSFFCRRLIFLYVKKVLFTILLPIDVSTIRT